MNCQNNCGGQMVSMKLTLECRAGNAEKYKCRKCAGEFWVQLTVGESSFRPLRETQSQLARDITARREALVAA